MPVSSVIWKHTNLRSSQVGALLFRKLYFNSQKNNLFTPVNIEAPLSSRQGVGVLRHLSATPSLQIFAKLTSLISKLAVEPDVPQRPLEHKTTSDANSKIEELHKEITGSSTKFLEEYDKNLTDLVEQVKPPPKEINRNILIRTAKRVYKHRERTQKSKERIRFFHVNKPSRPVVTAHFKETYEFLQSIDVPCDELQYFPDIQRMTQEEIAMCIERLKSYGIQRVFSLFLIQRALAEMKIGLSSANPTSMRDGRRSVGHLSQVHLYLSLCELLEQPDLDIVSLLDMLTEANGYESMATLRTKVKKLLSIGATPDIIWNNLDLLTFHRDHFSKKIKLYKRSRFSPDTPFPVALFLSKSFVTFQERISLGQDVLDIAEMLDIKAEEFQACWGFMKLSLPELVQKVRMCIKVGIPKKDVFNNLSILNNIPIKKCYEVTTQFKESRLPASIFIFREMDQANGINGNNLSSTNGMTGQDARPSQQSQGIRTNEQDDNIDWTGNGEPKPSSIMDFSSMSNNSSLETEKKKKKRVNLILDGTKPLTSSAGDSMTALPAKSTKQKLPNKVSKASSYNQVESSKRSRQVLFYFVAHLLSLEPDAVSGIFRCNLSTSSVNRLDVTRNLDFLLLPVSSGGGGFTLPQVAQCPLILVHPHAQLRAVARSAPEMLASYLASYSSSSPLTSTSASSSQLSSSSQWDDLDEDDKREERTEVFEPLCEVDDDSEALGSPVDGYRSFKPVSSQLLSSSSSPSPSLTSIQPTTSSSFSTLSSSSSSAGNGNDIEEISPINNFSAAETTDPLSLTSLLFSCPVRNLNLVQYLLERESSFNLGTNGTTNLSGFLNRPV